MLTKIDAGWQAGVCIDNCLLRRSAGVGEVALWRRLAAEFLGSAFLAALVIGSGIAAQRLSPGDTGLELLENAAATAAGLFAIILMFGPVSGGHFNPVVSFVDAAFRGISWRDAAAYVPAQLSGCIAGAIAANLMFALPAVTSSAKNRATPAHFLSEIIATLGLIVVIFALARSGRSHVTPAAVGAYIGAAYFFTSSASFANPAITIGRMFSNTFAGIAPSSAPAFIAAQVIGGILAIGLVRVLYPGMTPTRAADVTVPRDHAGAAERLPARAASDAATATARQPSGPGHRTSPSAASPITCPAR
jgi:glycerol uptake facilitator-like aquaporin